MGGVCAAMDTVPNPHVWMLGKLGLINCTDKDFPRTTGTSGSMVMPFLKRMALLYPGYNFIGERYAGPCNKARDLFQEAPHREHIIKVIQIGRNSNGCDMPKFALRKFGAVPRPA